MKKLLQFLICPAIDQKKQNIKPLYSRFILSFLLCITGITAFSQHSDDSLKLIFNSHEFTLHEKYIGDWGGYTYDFVFTLKNDSVKVLWNNPVFYNGESQHPITVSLPVEKLTDLKKIFIDCSHYILSTHQGSTEHIIYTFKSKQLSYTIDDNFSMACYEDFKLWKEMLMEKAITNKKQ